MNLKKILMVTLGGACLTATLTVSANEKYPERPITFVVPFSTGTGSDTIARLMADAMSKPLGQSVIVENRGGAGGITGTKYGADAKPDGYVLTVGTTSTLITNPVLNPLAQYDVERDFSPVTGLGRAYFVIVTANTPDTPKSLDELVERLKKEGGTYASSGVGTITHLASEALLHQTGAQGTHVPYKGSNAALTDTAGGHVLFASDTLAAALPMIQSNRLRALAVTAENRVASLPDIPTVMETGIPNFRVDAWWGLVAPKGTPNDVLEKLSDAAAAALSLDSTKKTFKTLELEPMPMRSAEFADLIKTQKPVWSKFIKEANISLN